MISLIFSTVFQSVLILRKRGDEVYFQQNEPVHCSEPIEGSLNAIASIFGLPPIDIDLPLREYESQNKVRFNIFDLKTGKEIRKLDKFDFNEIDIAVENWPMGKSSWLPCRSLIDDQFQCKAKCMSNVLPDMERLKLA